MFVNIKLLNVLQANVNENVVWNNAKIRVFHMEKREGIEDRWLMRNDNHCCILVVKIMAMKIYQSCIQLWWIYKILWEGVIQRRIRLIHHTFKGFNVLISILFQLRSKDIILAVAYPFYGLCQYFKGFNGILME